MGFLKNHLQTHNHEVNSSAVPPKPVHHYLGSFMPAEFSHLENPRRGVDVLAQRPQPRRQSDLFETIISNVDAQTVDLIGE